MQLDVEISKGDIIVRKLTKKVRQFFLGQLDGIGFHAAGALGLGDEGRGVGSGETIGCKPGDAKVGDEFVNPLNGDLGPRVATEELGKFVVTRQRGALWGAGAEGGSWVFAGGAKGGGSPGLSFAA